MVLNKFENQPLSWQKIKQKTRVYTMKINDSKDLINNVCQK